MTVITILHRYTGDTVFLSSRLDLLEQLLEQCSQELGYLLLWCSEGPDLTDSHSLFHYPLVCCSEPIHLPCRSLREESTLSLLREHAEYRKWRIDRIWSHPVEVCYSSSLLCVVPSPTTRQLPTGSVPWNNLVPLVCSLVYWRIFLNILPVRWHPCCIVSKSWFSSVPSSNWFSTIRILFWLIWSTFPIVLYAFFFLFPSLSIRQMILMSHMLPYWIDWATTPTPVRPKRCIQSLSTEPFVLLNIWLRMDLMSLVYYWLWMIQIYS